jgi:TRAP-type C4-dicarboxylate transport system substrate-binding protein
MGMDQVYNAMTTGVVDGAENNPPSYDSFNHYPVAKNYTLTEHLIIPEILVFSKRTFDSMSKEDQALLLKLSKEAQAEQRKLWDERSEQSMKKIRDAGINVITLSPAEKQKFQDSVKPVWDKYGGKYADLVKRIQAVNS